MVFILGRPAITAIEVDFSISNKLVQVHTSPSFRKNYHFARGPETQRNPIAGLLMTKKDQNTTDEYIQLTTNFVQ